MKRQIMTILLAGILCLLISSATFVNEACGDGTITIIKDATPANGADFYFTIDIDVFLPPIYLTQWGSLGSDAGQFNEPLGVAVDSSGYVYVVDSVNFRIQKFDSNGVCLTQWGSYGSGDGQFIYPWSVAVDSSGYVYVADGDRIQKFDSSGTYLTQWDPNSPWGIAVDSSGNVYATDNHGIQKFDSNGVYLTQWGSDGSGDGQFMWPKGVAVDSSGYVYVADTGNDRIQKFDSSGAYLTQWGSYGSGDGQFDGPGGVAVDSRGYVYVGDLLNSRIQKFDNNGTCLGQWGSHGSGDGQFYGPIDVAVNSHGQVYVSEQMNHRIQKFHDGFSLDDAVPDDGDSISDRISFPVKPGTYSIAEIVPENWDLSSAICDNGDTPDDVRIDLGETVTCTFTNTEDEDVIINRHLSKIFLAMVRFSGYRGCTDVFM